MLSAIDIEILEARMQAVIDRKIPIYWKATAEHPRDCLQKVNEKNYYRNILRMKMAKDNSLIDLLEKELGI